MTLPQRLRALHRLAVVALLGFASGVPLALTGQAMQAWLTVEGLSLATIGFLSLVGLPYTFKFLWAPLMDRFELPLLGRRRGWLVLTQLLLAGVLLALSATSPRDAIRVFALLAVAVAFMSASQDVVIDAYRTDLLPPAERGLGASLGVMGYRLAMILSGGVAMIWTDPGQMGGPGGGWTWPEVYRFMAALMAGAAVLSALILPNGALFFCDTHLNLDPTAEQIAEMTLLAAKSVRRFGLAPKAALLSHSSFGSSDSPSARKMRAAMRILRDAEPDFELDGEMHADAALSDVLRGRYVSTSPLTGSANLLVMPSLDAANIALTLLSAATEGLLVGPLLLGVDKPVHVMVPSVTARGIVNMTALAVAQAASQS